MAQKLMVNQTGYQINGTIIVRNGGGNPTPGNEFGTVPFTLGPNGQQMVPYGDANDPYVDQMEVSALTNGAVVLSNQMVIVRGTPLDNEFNMNDTVYINVTNNNFVISTGNTWTV